MICFYNHKETSRQISTDVIFSLWLFQPLLLDTNPFLWVASCFRGFSTATHLLSGTQTWTLTWPFRNPPFLLSKPFFVRFVVCWGSLSCWKVHLCSDLSRTSHSLEKCAARSWPSYWWLCSLSWWVFFSRCPFRGCSEAVQGFSQRPGWEASFSCKYWCCIVLFKKVRVLM